jgi:regulator of RNase E activity RraA
MNSVRINTAAPLPDEELVARFSALPVPAISDSLERTPGAVGLLPVGGCLDHVAGSVAGPALTVRTRIGDNLAVHKALELARPGEVLVVDAGGDGTNAIMGELMARYAASRGILAAIIDGAIRDSQAVSEGDFPVFARSVSHLGPYKSGPGEIHGPVSLGGTTVLDGDLVVGDRDGIVIVPRSRAEEVADAAEAVVTKEEVEREAIDRGEWDRSWIDEVADLEATGVATAQIAGGRR